MMGLGLKQMWLSSLFQEHMLRCAGNECAFPAWGSHPSTVFAHVVMQSTQSLRQTIYPSLRPSLCSLLICPAPLTGFVFAEGGSRREIYWVSWVDAKAKGLWLTYGWQSLTRSWSVVPGWRPRMYRLVLLSCSPPMLPLLPPLPPPLLRVVVLLMLLLLLLGLERAIWWLEGGHIRLLQNKERPQLHLRRYSRTYVQ